MLTPKQKSAMGIPLFKSKEDGVKYLTERVIHILTSLGREKEISPNLRMYKWSYEGLYRKCCELEEERLKKGADKYQKELFA